MVYGLSFHQGCAMPTRDEPIPQLSPAADMRRRLKAIFIGSVGNLVEWYDFYAYAAFALYFAGAFFPYSDPVVQQLNAAICSPRAYRAPAGRLAVRPSRRPLRPPERAEASVLLMCFGSLMIAVTPTYASIGIAAPVVLGLARIFAGPQPRRRIRHQRHLSQSRWPTRKIAASIRASNTSR